ncbi:G-box-binding factor-like [Drosophila sulfurigaster albostrigata]|uniref:G-box-binding factor-like n=1 Tax=Drosophila sulfurigaster albostrigata TaxID=89887 RepID=UPI002D21D10F|nr:G-box-binding factor-like [Drosophila sulfurigaster albostrigata]XP_062128044.1 G-box-binding factor-like [Drosophila sulfurigaster albostrigata]XP_062128045.1 G-box-binding factor-like [Drosophila sulfurigaster albostrigata]
MLAFHNEHIASCAFLTYFSPDSSTTAANSPTSGTQATLYNDKQSITGVAYPCGALSVRRMRWQQHQQQLQQQQQQQHHQQHHHHHHHRQLYAGPYARVAPAPRLQQQHHYQQQQLQQQSSGVGLISRSRSNLREICKTHAIC